jgi:hypothetical protein
VSNGVVFEWKKSGWQPPGARLLSRTGYLLLLLLSRIGSSLSMLMLFLPTLHLQMPGAHPSTRSHPPPPHIPLTHPFPNQSVSRSKVKIEIKQQNLFFILKTKG